jgi:hypothetical protein
MITLKAKKKEKKDMWTPAGKTLNAKTKTPIWDVIRGSMWQDNRTTRIHQIQIKDKFDLKQGRDGNGSALFISA